MYSTKVAEDHAAKWQAMEEENTRLRNKVMAANEQIFELQATMMTCEAEAKFYVETELKKIQSETNFRTKEFANLSREHQNVLKELAGLKQSAKNSASSSSKHIITPSQVAASNTTPQQDIRSAPESATVSIEKSFVPSPVPSSSSSNYVTYPVLDYRYVFPVLISQYHQLLLGLANAHDTIAPIAKLVDSTEPVTDVLATPRDLQRIGAPADQQVSGTSARLSPTSLGRIKQALQTVSDESAERMQHDELLEVLSRVNECFYASSLAESTLDHPGSTSLIELAVRLLPLNKLLLANAVRRQQFENSFGDEQRQSPLALGLSLTFTALCFIGPEEKLSDSTDELPSEAVSVVGNLSKRFEQVAGGAQLSEGRVGSKRKVSAEVDQDCASSSSRARTVTPLASASLSIKLPALSDPQRTALVMLPSSAVAGPVSVARRGRFTAEYCQLCSDVLRFAVDRPPCDGALSSALSSALLLLSRKDVSAVDVLPCLTSAEETVSCTPALNAVLLCDKVPWAEKTKVVAVLARALGDRRVFHEVVLDQHRHPKQLSQTSYSSSKGGVSLREEDEERTTTADAVEQNDAAAAAAARLAATGRSGSLLHILTRLLEEDSSLEQLEYQNRVVMLLQDLLSRHGCQFISWLVGRSAEDVMSSVGDVNIALTISSSEVGGVGAGKQTTPVDAAVAGGTTANKTPNSKHSAEYHTPVTSTSLALTPASTHAKLPIDFVGFGEIQTPIDRLVVNRLIVALCQATRSLDGNPVNSRSTLVVPSGADTTLLRLTAQLVHRLVNLLNGIAGRMSPADWSTLISDKHDHLNAFLCRSAVNIIHGDALVKSAQYECLDRDIPE